MATCERRKDENEDGRNGMLSSTFLPLLHETVPNDKKMAHLVLSSISNESLGISESNVGRSSPVSLVVGLNREKMVRGREGEKRSSAREVDERDGGKAFCREHEGGRKLLTDDLDLAGDQG